MYFIRILKSRNVITLYKITALSGEILAIINTNITMIDDFFWFFFRVKLSSYLNMREKRPEILQNKFVYAKLIN
jgi:hypothetical protein